LDTKENKLTLGSPVGLGLDCKEFFLMPELTPDGLIGFTGFVGSSLHRSAGFARLFNSVNFRDMSGCSFSTLVCCGVPAVKWLANKDPDADKAAIEALEGVLRSVRAERFVLISTVDVYPCVSGSDEATDCNSPNHPYGTHRLNFERFVRSQFDSALIVRLPALFGRGLKKNVLFDMLAARNLDQVSPRSSFQWYSVDRLWSDILRADAAGIDLLNVATEPLQTKEIAHRYFPELALGPENLPVQFYDVRTMHCGALGGAHGYLIPKEATLSAMAEFIRKSRAAAGLEA
jgi:hypothetical protein